MLMVSLRRRIICLWLALLGGSSFAWAGELPGTEVGHPFVQNFSAREYRADPQVWCLAQDGEGVLYFGNRGVVLEYDGVTWRKIRISEDTNVIRALGTDPGGGTVYIGGLNDLGCLQTSAEGDKMFVSWRARLPAGDQNFGSVYKVHPTAEGIFFVAAKQVMRWRAGKFTVWKFQSEDRLQSGYVAGQLFIQSPSIGLQRLEGDRFVPASEDPFFRSATLAGMAPGPGGELIVATRHNGVFKLDQGVLVPLAAEVTAFFKSHGVHCLRRLRDGSLVVATITAGVVVLDADNRIRDHWDETSGLQNQTALDCLEDREGGVWLGLYVGISRVQTGSPLSLFDESNGLKRSSIHCVRRCRGTLYVATEAGLYRVVKSDPIQGTAARCERVPGLDSDVWGLCPGEHGVLVSGIGTLYELADDGKVTLIDRFPDSPASLSPSRRWPGRVFFGTRLGLRSIRFDQATARWVDEGFVPGVAAEVHSYAEDAGGDLWVGSQDHGLFRVRFAPDEADGQRGSATVTSFFGRPGLLAGVDDVWVGLLPDGSVAAGTREGISRFEAAVGDFRMMRDYGARFADGSLKVEMFMPDQRAGIWLNIRSNGDLSMSEQAAWAVAGGQDGQGSRSEDLPHQIIDKLTELDCIYPDRDGVAWFASPDGLVRLDTQAWLQERQKKPAGFTALIRRATATARTAGAHRGAVPAVLALPTVGARLDAAHNSVGFEVAAATYLPGADLLYQTRLRGFGDDQWTAWGSRTRDEYTNLPAGNYVFEARARNGDGVQGRMASVSFSVAPPWQRAPWAYALYAALAAAGVYALVRWQLWRLRAQNTRLEEVIEARTGELRHAKDAAESANRAKSAFLANMTHELRTPLNAILGYSQILLKDPDLSTRNRERVSTVDRSGHHLLSMINEVLDLSKIEAGKLALLPIDFSLDALLDDLCGAFRPRFAEKGIAFECTHTPHLPAVIHTDAGKLRQVLFNLLGNALKFTHQGEVRLELCPAEGGKVRFSVVDTGVGIAARELRHIFLAFHQAGDIEAATQGTGLGLSISQRLVELLGGRLEVESSPGHGSRFSFELDLPAVAGAGALLAVDANDPSLCRVIGFQGPPRRLLIVDDETVNRQVLSELLAPLGFEIEEAADGVEGLRRCAEQAPDALLLDLRMRPVGGLEVARTLRRQTGRGAAIRIVAVSASAFADDRQQAMEAGCDDFLSKPFKEEQLLAVLGRVLRLEWIRAEASVDQAAASPAADSPRFATEIEALLDLSRNGDILQLKARFAVLCDAGGIPEKHLPLVRRLEPLIASYEVDRVHDVLRQFQHDANF